LNQSTDVNICGHHELIYEQPHPLHTPTDTETNQTKDEVAKREVQIEALNAKIRDLRAKLDAESHEKVAELRPIMDYLHDQILVIQKQMADAWNAFTTERQQAEAVVTAKVTDLEVQIHILKEENSKAACPLALIRRLPVEMLAEIFTLCISCHTHSPLELMRVCRSWRAVVLTTPPIWSDLRLGTWSKTENVESILGRIEVGPLDVEIDTGIDMSKVVDANEVRRYAGLELAATEAKRWRNLLDIDTHSTPETPAIVFNGLIDELESFKITKICEDSVVFSQLLDVVGSSSHGEPTDMELTSPSAIYHLAQPQFASTFRSLVALKVDICEMRTEVDILAQFQQLEALEAYGLQIPTYTLHTDLPVVRTLKRMKIKSVSVQWMAGRTFPNMEDCTITWPHYPEMLALGGGVDLPLCTHFMYCDHITDTLTNFRIPKLDTLIVRNEAWNKPRGSMQLAAVWNGTAGQAPPLKPRVLHLDTQCHDRHLINALSMLSELEELRLGVARPDGLGKEFFSALQAKGEKNSPSGATHVATVCPVLKAFGIRYRCWIRDDEGDEITPLLRMIIESRQKTDTPLQSFKFWPTKETPEEGAAELCIVDNMFKTKTVSVKWIAGDRLPNMEDCTIVWPHCPETLAPDGRVDLPACTHFTYDDHIIDTLPNTRIPILDTLVVRNKPSKQAARRRLNKISGRAPPPLALK